MKKNRGMYLPGAALGNFGFCTSWAVDTHGGSREWIEVIEVDLSLPNLPKEFHGKRIIQISDLHCSKTVSAKYLMRCIERINMLKADIVVLTGDYVTHDYYGRFQQKVAMLLGKIESRLGVYACLGNHDYGVGGAFRLQKKDMLKRMIAEMQAGGVNVLRNESAVLEVGGKQLWFVGLGDLWANDFKPQKAFSGISGNGAVIALAHNPMVIKELHEFTADAVVSGHTHGSQIEWTTSLKGLAVNRRSYYSGMYQVGSKKLYVNRGLGRLGRAIFNTRPEITIFSLC